MEATYFTREMAHDETNLRKEITGVAYSCGSGRTVSAVLGECKMYPKKYDLFHFVDFVPEKGYSSMGDYTRRNEYGTTCVYNRCMCRVQSMHRGMQL